MKTKLIITQIYKIRVLKHTTGTASGYYMYTEVSRREKGDKARLLSPIQSAKSGKCLVFWYHSYGLGKYALNNIHFKIYKVNNLKMWEI